MATTPDHSSLEYSRVSALHARVKAVAHLPAHSLEIATTARNRKSATRHAVEHSTHAETPHSLHANDPKHATRSPIDAAHEHVPHPAASKRLLPYGARLSSSHPI